MTPVSKKSNVVPFSFALIGGRWMPYEFVGAECLQAVAGLQRVRGKPEFLNEMAALVTKHGVQDLLGFHVLHRDFLQGELRGTVETPGSSVDELLIRPFTEKLFQALQGGP